MKKILCLIISVFFVLTFSMAAFAEEGFFLNSTPGEDGTFEVKVAYYGEKKPVVAQFTVDFDPEKLDCVEAFSGDALQGATAPTIHIVDGKVYFVWDSLSGSSEGTFLEMVFKGKTEASGEATIGFDPEDRFIFADENYSPLCPAEQIPHPVTLDLGDQEESALHSEKETEEEPEKQAENKPDIPAAERAKEDQLEETGYNRGISMEENKAEMAIGEHKALHVIEEGKREKLVWSSSNESVATVNEKGEIVAVAPGETIIMVSDENGEKESTCVVTVTEGSVSAQSPQTENEGSDQWVPIVAGGIVILGMFGFFLYKKTVFGRKI